LRPIEAGQFAACHLHDLPAAQNPMAETPYCPASPLKETSDRHDRSP
jgi:hypothetical protein